MSTTLSLTESILFLKKLVLTQTSSYNYTGINVCLDIIKKEFMRFDAKATLIKSDSNNTNNIPIALKLTKNPEADTKWLFNIHVDTVFDQQSSFNDFIINEDHTQATGPGVIDAKGGIVIIRNTIKLLESAPFSKDIGWTVLITTDEEIGSLESKSIIEREARRHDYAFVFEPPLDSGNLIKERPSSSNILFTAKGKAGHAGRDYKEAKNAITGLIALINTLPPLTSPTHTINLGTIQGGTRENIIADSASCALNARFMIDSELKDFIKQCEEQALLIQEKTGIKLSVAVQSFRPSKPSTPKSSHLYTMLDKAAKEANITLSYENSFGVCDGNFIAHQGTPVIDTMGAKGFGMHTKNETIYLDSLITQSQLAFGTIKHIYEHQQHAQ